MPSTHLRHGGLLTLVALGLTASPARAYDWDRVVLRAERVEIVFARDATPADVASLRHAARFIRAASELVPEGSELHVHCVDPGVRVESATSGGSLSPAAQALQDAFDREWERRVDRGLDPMPSGDWHRLRTCLAHVARFVRVATRGRLDVDGQSARIYTLRVSDRASFRADYGMPEHRLGGLGEGRAASGSLLIAHDEMSYPAQNLGLFLEREDASAAARRLTEWGLPVEVVDLTRVSDEGFEMPEP